MIGREALRCKAALNYISLDRDEARFIVEHAKDMDDLFNWRAGVMHAGWLTLRLIALWESVTLISRQ